MPIFFLPCAGQIGALQFVVHQRLFQFEAHQNVEIIRRFIGLDTNQRGPHVVDRRVKIIQRHVAQRFGKLFLRRTIKTVPKRPAAADQIFPQPRLRFVNAQRHRLARRQAVELGPQSLIVNAVPRFVQHAEKRAGKMPLVVTGSNAAIVRPQAGAKRMRRHVEPAALKIEPQSPGDFLGERFLRSPRKSAFKNLSLRPPFARANIRHQRH